MQDETLYYVYETLTHIFTEIEELVGEMPEHEQKEKFKD